MEGSGKAQNVFHFLQIQSNIRAFMADTSRPNKKKILFPVPAHITFGERIKKNFLIYLIEFDVFDTTINCFSVKADPFCPLF